MSGDAPRLSAPALLWTLLKVPGYTPMFLASWLMVLTLFIWVPQVNLAWYIITQTPLGFAGKISFFLDYLPRILASFVNPVVFTMLIFSLLTALSIVLLIFLRRTLRELQARGHSHIKAYAATATSAFGSHLLSCGGTILLAAVFPAYSGSTVAFGGSGAAVNTWLATTANLMGILVVLYTIRKLSRDCVQIFITQPVA